MASTTIGTAGRVLGLSAVCGMRSMTPPALLSITAARGGGAGLNGTLFRWLASGKTATALGLLAAAEIAVDKLPSTPARTSPGPIFGRSGLGALIGAAIYTSAGSPVAVGTALGALSAAAGTYATYYARLWAGKTLGPTDPAVALVEDAIALGTAYTLARGWSRR